MEKPSHRPDDPMAGLRARRPTAVGLNSSMWNEHSIVLTFDPYSLPRDRRRLAATEERAAMRYEVNECEPDVEIRVDEATGRTSQLLESMQACQTGSCGCPTDQYDKLAAMEVDAEDDKLTVRLQPLPGERLDVEQVKACLDYTIAQADG